MIFFEKLSRKRFKTSFFSRHYSGTRNFRILAGIKLFRMKFLRSKWDHVDENFPFHKFRPVWNMGISHKFARNPVKISHFKRYPRETLTSYMPVLSPGRPGMLLIFHTHKSDYGGGGETFANFKNSSSV